MLMRLGRVQTAGSASSAHRVRHCYVPSTVCRSAADDEPPQISGNWREFRARLVKETGASSSQFSEENLSRLKLDSPSLAAEGVWCHETPKPEKGGLLIATLKSTAIKKTERYEQVVAVLVEHSDQGSIALILNRPTSMVMGKRPNGMPLKLSNAPDEVQTVFADNRLYCGGFTAQHVIHLVHGHPLPGAVEVVPGIFMGGEAAAAKEVGEGRLRAEDFRFFAGAIVWDVGELDAEAAAGCWFSAASSRAVVLKQCLQLPTPLWIEVLQLLGGDYARVADDDNRE